MARDTDNRPRLLVLGLGNILSGDDGIGAILIQQLAERIDSDWPVELIEAGVGGLRLLNLVEAAPAILAIDAAEMRLPPAEVRWLTPRQLSEPAQLGYSLHNIDFAQTLRLVQQFFSRPPTAILAIQIGQAKPGTELSETLRAALPQMLTTAVEALKNWRDRADMLDKVLSDPEIDGKDRQLLAWLRPNLA